MRDFNVVTPIGSIFENRFHKKLGNPVSKLEEEKLVEFVAYCLNPNHFHFLLKQVSDGGAQEFMHRLGGGYTKYFNHRYKRVGSLFQGPFKAIHVDNDEYLLHLSAYINLNDRVHGLGIDAQKLHRSSWNEYLGKTETNLCAKEIILERFNSIADFTEYALDAVRTTIEGRAPLEVRNLYSE